MRFLIVLIFFLLTNCSKPKTVLICGNHICLNKTEAKQYFEENLSIEVKIIDKKDKKEFDLIEINLNDTESEKRNVTIVEKKNTNENIKVLSKQEIIKIKKT